MQRRFWTSIKRAGFTAMALSVIFTGADTSGQDVALTEDVALTQDSTQPPKQTTEPVFRVPKVTNQGPDSVQAELGNSKALPQAKTQDAPNVDRVADSRNLPSGKSKLPKPTPAMLPSSVAGVPVSPNNAVLATKKVPHPLDRAVDFAEVALEEMRGEVRDYTALLAKREFVNGVVGAPSYMNVKIRCPRKNADGTSSPFSVYMKFLRPKAEAGREVIWVEGQNDNKLIVHEGSGIIRLKKFHLEPTGRLAMTGNRYPIFEAGLENLIIKLIEKAERDRAAGPCKVTYREGAQINKRPCSLIELVHEERRAPYEFHKAQVFIDKELNLPVRFAAYDWPAAPGATPQLLEEYTYYNVKLNVGLSDHDFNPNNKAYKFPAR